MASYPPELSWVGVSVRVRWQGERERKGGYRRPWLLFKATQHQNPLSVPREPPSLGVLVSGKITTVKVKNSDNLVLSHPFISNRGETQAPPVCIHLL